MMCCWLISICFFVITGEKANTQQIDWNERGQQELRAALNVEPKLKPAKNVIIFIGDGMGVSTLTAARIFKAQKNGDPVPDGALSWESMPYTGVVKTYNTNQQTPDSAGTTTAILSGEKTQAYVIGVNQNVSRGDCASVAGNEVKSILTYGMEEGKWAGIVTTTRITHATPAAGYAHTADRDWEDDADLRAAEIDPDTCWDIGRQLIHNDMNKNIRVLLGGGRKNLMPTNTSDPEYPILYGLRQDGRNLIEDWKSFRTDMGVHDENFAYVENKASFDAVDVANTEYLMGLFEYDMMKFDAIRLEEVDGQPWAEPSIADMVRKAIGILRKGKDGFILLVEGGRIDHAHHANNAYRALTDTLALDDAVQVAMEMTDEEDTLVVVTADHSHTFTIAGYPDIDNDILGVVVDTDLKTTLDNDGLPYLTLGYANGPGFNHHKSNGNNITVDSERLNLTDVDTNYKNFRQDATVPLDLETHAGADVVVYARGPMSHLFVGQHEQNYLAHAAMYAACVGKNKELCDTQPEPTVVNDPVCTSDGTRVNVHTMFILTMFVVICNYNFVICNFFTYE